MKGLCYSALSYAPLFIDRIAIVIGDGDLALRSAAELATVARQVSIVCGGDKILATPIGQKLLAADKVTVLNDHELVEVLGDEYLLLDCGLIQRGEAPLERNRAPFQFDAAQVDAVVLSHAHIDHCGRLPLLRKRGFRGPIHSNPACRDLARILLADSATMQERDAERANRRRQREGDPRVIEPLYTLEDALDVLQQFRTVRYGQPVEVLPGVELTFRDAGHILGSTSVWLTLREGALERGLVFSGDVGQYDMPILRDPEAGAPLAAETWLHTQSGSA